MDAERIAKEAALALEEKQGADIRIFDVRGISGITDFTVVASGTSAPHLKAMAAEVERRLGKAGVKSHRVSGEPASGWVIADYVDAVVHIFSAEARAYYAIERLWSKKDGEADDPAGRSF